MTANELRRIYREDVGRKYTSLGSYPTFFILNDGASLCHDCVRANRSQIVRATLTPRDHSGWSLAAREINWEDPELYCDHCGDRIESAYAEDEAKS